MIEAIASESVRGAFVLGMLIGWASAVLLWQSMSGQFRPPREAKDAEAEIKAQERKRY